mmetsp:Transcript_23900/g.68038  ORF Transcript_23900/g.68038 Transcript_23900/m.68038 type:complete len:230 (-) Transcript_23900:697-1386(-)
MAGVRGKVVALNYRIVSSYLKPNDRFDFSLVYKELTSGVTLHHRINKPGGCARITRVHCAVDGEHVESLDVKYVLDGAFEREIDPAIVSHYEMLERGGRRRRRRQFFMEQTDIVVRKRKRPTLAKHARGGEKSCKQKTAKKMTKKSTILITIKYPARHVAPPSTPVTPEHPTASKQKDALNDSQPQLFFNGDSAAKNGHRWGMYGHQKDDNWISWYFCNFKKRGAVDIL